MKEFTEKLISRLEEKIKVTSLKIIVTGTKDKPYFEIEYKEVGKEDYNTGYSSYELNNVFDWKDKCFEIVKKQAEEYLPDICAGNKDGWIPVEERLPERKEKKKQFGNKQKRTNVLVTLRNGIVKEMMYEFETKEFWELGDENPIEHWKEDVMDSDFEVIAWQPLPEPYREKGEREE